MRLSPSVKLLAPLTPREAEVLRWALRGYATRDIARELHVRSSTIETHCQHIDRKIPGNRPRREKWALWAAGCPIDYLSITRLK